MSSIERIDSPIGKISICQRSGRFFAGSRVDGKWVRIGLKTSDLTVAKSRALEWLQKKIQPKSLSWARPDDHESVVLLRKAFLRARKRAMQSGQEFLLNYDRLLSRATLCGMCCELSGIAYSAKKNHSFRAPFCPTIDRIDCKKGYTEDNIRIVCAAVNWALSDWGDEVFNFVCLSVAMMPRAQKKQ